MISIDENGVVTVREMTQEEKAKEIERMRSRARHNEASALGHARREGIEEGAKIERGKWQVIVADKDVLIADKAALIADKAALIADKEALLANMDALIAELRSKLGEQK